MIPIDGPVQRRVLCAYNTCRDALVGTDAKTFVCNELAMAKLGPVFAGAEVGPSWDPQRVELPMSEKKPFVAPALKDEGPLTQITLTDDQ